MSTLLDVLTGLGVALAVGLRPFLPALVVGLLALADATIDFDGTSFAFLESAWLLIVLLLLTGLLLTQGPRLASRTGRLALIGVGAVLGALLFAGTLDEHSATWWPGIVLGAAFAAFAAFAASGVVERARNRLDASTQATFPLYLEAGAALLALLSVLLPPVGLVALVGFALLLRGGRRREGEKYAGLRILR